MKKTLLAGLAVYVTVVSWLGFNNADPALAEAFSAQAGALLMTMLVLLYGTVAALTMWLVTLLSCFTHKLACGGHPPSPATTHVVQGLVLAALFSRIPALVGQQSFGTNLGLVAFAVPVALAIVALVRDRSLVGARKVVAFLPLFLYIGADIALLLNAA